MLTSDNDRCFLIPGWVGLCTGRQATIGSGPLHGDHSRLDMHHIRICVIKLNFETNCFAFVVGLQVSYATTECVHMPSCRWHMLS